MYGVALALVLTLFLKETGPAIRAQIEQRQMGAW
jgi:hypothetical protein